MDLRDIEPNARPPRRARRETSAAPGAGRTAPGPTLLTPFGGAGYTRRSGRAGAGGVARGPVVDAAAGWDVAAGLGGSAGVDAAAVPEAPEVPVHEIDVLVVGAGQAGLATAYQLQRAGFHGYAPTLGRHAGERDDGLSFVVLDAEDGPGGAWQHRWDSLTMATVNGITDLPGAALERSDPELPAKVAVTRYFADYEDDFDLPVLRPVRVLAVERQEGSERLRVRTTGAQWQARIVIAASGTWGRPFWPHVPGIETFRGTQVHTRDFPGAEYFQDQRVVVVGAGISAVGHLLEIAEVADTLWATRRPPDFRDTPFDEDAGRRVEEAVRARIDQGLPTRSVVSETGLLRTPAVERGIAEGVLDAQPMFTGIDPGGIVWPDGRRWDADAIVWATGFRHDLPYLRPLRLRTPQGGILREGTRVLAEPRVHLVGLGADSSTIGARRSARQAVKEIAEYLGAH